MLETNEYWRSGYTDDQGWMHCSCGFAGFTIEYHAERVRVTRGGDPVTEEGRTVYRCGSCSRAVIPLQNFDHLAEAEPGEPLTEDFLRSIVDEGGGGVA